MALRMHPVIRLEEAPREIHERSVSRMIERLDSRNPFSELRLCLLDVRGELGFRAGGSGDEDRTRGGERLRDVLQELLVQRCVAAIT